MPISSLIVRAHPGMAPAVAEALECVPSARVTDVAGDDLVVLTETRGREEDQAMWDRIESTEGVLSASLVYHAFEDLEVSHGDGHDPA